AVDFDALDVEGRVDWTLLTNRIATDRRNLDFADRRAKEFSGLVPYAGRVFALHSALRTQAPTDPEKDAAALDELRREIETARTAADKGESTATEIVARREAQHVDELRRCL